MVSRTLNANPEHCDPRRQRLEDAARATLDLDADRTLTDAEWARARTRLLEWVAILRAWDQQVADQ
jgi:hypothetical protein